MTPTDTGVSEEIWEAAGRKLYETIVDSGYDEDDPKTYWRAADGYWKNPAVWDSWVDDVRKVIEAIAPRLKADDLRETREKLASWMIKNSFATGHGDTFDDLLNDLSVHVKELRSRVPVSRATLEMAQSVLRKANAEDCYENITAAEREIADALSPQVKETKREEKSAFDTLPDDYETGDY